MFNPVTASIAADVHAVIVVPDMLPALIVGSSAVALSHHTTNLVAESLQILTPVVQLHVVPSDISTSVPAVIVVHDTVHAVAYALSPVLFWYATTNRLVERLIAANIPSSPNALDTACSVPRVGVLCAKVITLAYMILSALF